MSAQPDEERAWVRCPKCETRFYLPAQHPVLTSITCINQNCNTFIRLATNRGEAPSVPQHRKDTY